MARDSAQKGMDIHERIIGLDCETLGAMWNIILQEYFGTTDKDTLSSYEEVMNYYASFFALVVVTLETAEKNIPLEVRKGLSRDVMAHLREVADTLKPIDGI